MIYTTSMRNVVNTGASLARQTYRVLLHVRPCVVGWKHGHGGRTEIFPRVPGERHC